MDLIQLRLKLNPALKHHYSNVIKRVLKGLVLRNKTHDSLRIVGPPTPEHMTLYGEPLLSIPRSCVLQLRHQGWLYWFDARELVQYLYTTISGVLNNPYNGKPFTLYQKYYILRHFYHAVKCSDYQPLEVSSVTQVYVSPQETINGISEILGMTFLKTISVKLLYELVHQLVMHHTGTVTHYRRLNWINYCYCQGNEEMFRYHVCLLIQELHDLSTDQEQFKLMISQRYCFSTLQDPISIESIIFNMLMVPALTSSEV